MLPQNSFTTWLANKQPQIIGVTTASDQVALLSFALPMFTSAAVPASPDTAAGFNAAQGPNIVPNLEGKGWLVTQIQASLATDWLQRKLMDPATFAR
jgi:hypothetical protein